MAAPPDSQLTVGPCGPEITVGLRASEPTAVLCASEPTATLCASEPTAAPRTSEPTAAPRASEPTATFRASFSSPSQNDSFFPVDGGPSTIIPYLQVEDILRMPDHPSAQEPRHCEDKITWLTIYAPVSVNFKNDLNKGLHPLHCWLPTRDFLLHQVLARDFLLRRSCCHAELRPSCDSAPRRRESPAGHAPHFPVGRRRSGTRGPARPCRPAPRPRGPDTRPPALANPRPLPPLPHPRLCHPVGPGCPGPRPSIPPTGVTGPAPSCRRRSPPPPVPRECGRSRPPHVPLAPFADTAGPVLAQVPSLLLRLCSSLRLPDLRCRALLARPRCAPCGRCRGKLCPPTLAFQCTPHTPSCPRAPWQCKRPRLTPSLPAFRRNPPVPARHRLRWDRSAPGRPAPPCRRRGVRTGGCSLCRACRRSSAASAVPAAAPALPLPCLPPLQRCLCRACRRSSPASAVPAAPARRTSSHPSSQRLHAAAPPPPPRRSSRRHPGSSPADEAAPPPPVVAFSLLPPPLHGGRSRAFPSAAPRFRVAG
uniref:uncharacterized protein LOC129132102 n=1 Tax=Agelaius phoeniceus TaxID=39638 RepID=UPI0023EDEA9E|nr:uncharacterized protein LOC129132102 [Agelaius phoeniceus]